MYILVTAYKAGSSTAFVGGDYCLLVGHTGWFLWSDTIHVLGEEYSLWD